MGLYFQALADICVSEGEMHTKLAVCAFPCTQSAAGCANLMYMPLYPRITACMEMKMKMGGKRYVMQALTLPETLLLTPPIALLQSVW